MMIKNHEFNVNYILILKKYEVKTIKPKSRFIYNAIFGIPTINDLTTIRRILFNKYNLRFIKITL